jgi:PAS domain S-box-containing protein
MDSSSRRPAAPTEAEELAQLTRERDMLRSAFEASTNAVAVLDLDGHVTGCNEATWKRLGFASKEELLGRPAGEFVFDRLGFEEQLRAVKADGVARKFECTLQSGGGAQRTLDLWLALQRDADGKPVGLVGIADDVTERRRAADSLRLLNRLAVDFAAIGRGEDVVVAVAEKVRAALDARVFLVALWEPATREMLVRHAAFAGGTFSAVTRIVGRAIVGASCQVDEALEKEMLSDVVSRHTDLSHLSMGLLPQEALAALAKLVGIGESYGLALRCRDSLVGASILVMPPCPFPPRREFLQVLAGLMSVTLGRTRGDEAKRP